MNLLTKAIRKQLPSLNANEAIGLEAKVIVKFFNPSGAGTWYATEYDGEDTFFGLVDLQIKELGYFSLSELQSLRCPPFGLGIERDLYFKSCTLQSLMP